MQMLKAFPLIVAITALTTSAASAQSWESSPNVGAQGIQGALTTSNQDGMYDLSFDCSAHSGENRTVFMTLATLPDAPLAPGNETTFPVTLRYEFGDGSVETAEVMVDWSYVDSDINHWFASFPMTKQFLNNFAQSQTLQLYTATNALIFQYDMSGSAKAAQALVEYCYSGNYN